MAYSVDCLHLLNEVKQLKLIDGLLFCFLTFYDLASQIYIIFKQKNATVSSTRRRYVY